jgi:hypothetical protein
MLEVPDYSDFPTEVRDNNESSRRDRFRHILKHLQEFIDAPVGSITVVTGPMYSGKSSFFYELQDLDSEYGGNKDFYYFKPIDDIRQLEIYSRDYEDKRIAASLIEHSNDIISFLREETLDLTKSVFCVDEVQFCDEGIIDVAEFLRYEGAHVVLCGLDTDFTGKSFELNPVDKDRYNEFKELAKKNGYLDLVRKKTMGDIMGHANLVVKILARNPDGSPATHSMRIGAREDDEVYQTGDKDSYFPTSVGAHNIISHRIEEFRRQHGL